MHSRLMSAGGLAQFYQLVLFHIRKLNQAKVSFPGDFQSFLRSHRVGFREATLEFYHSVINGQGFVVSRIRVTRQVHQVDELTLVLAHYTDRDRRVGIGAKVTSARQHPVYEVNKNALMAFLAVTMIQTSNIPGQPGNAAAPQLFHHHAGLTGVLPAETHKFRWGVQGRRDKGQSRLSFTLYFQVVAIHHGDVDIFQRTEENLVVDFEIGTVRILPALHDGRNFKLRSPVTGDDQVATVFDIVFQGFRHRPGGYHQVDVSLSDPVKVGHAGKGNVLFRK